MKKLVLLTLLASNAMAIDITALTAGASLGAKIGTKQLPDIIKSQKVYCARINGKNYLASIGAMKVFKATVSSRTRSIGCSDKVKREAMRQGVEVIQLSKSTLTTDAYTKLGKALTNGFGV